jgi:DNA-directed RNA polymerase subunit RPC12/RpoP
MKTIKMKLIKQSETMDLPVFQPAPDLDALIKGEGDTNYVCGNCEKVLFEAINKGQVTKIVVKCPVCGEFNLS